ncbi:phosphopantetheine-binding protein [Nostoc commune NIES-4072]|uniref:Phosphopantetheine-binding protein n=1 Tax=Nostoc commune NIES-4072 TaxID=2005467 RepID=A0A2R5FM46_NOSCO|nr:acyl carrier protein [Nostoc commune]BBD69135.1 phosphopantetheine-binding protein [Nostoc commune HK-02]GBG19867.1 phosphopantetheine-binding protein [Nostoc commune NIES-4072]
MTMQNLELNTTSTIALKQIPTAAEIQAWIVLYLADLLEVDSDEIEVTIPFDRYGLDSSAAVGLTGDLEDWLGCELDPTLLYDYPTVEALVKHLVSELKVEK